jgi:hypothetical protein
MFYAISVVATPVVLQVFEDGKWKNVGLGTMHPSELNTA